MMKKAMAVMALLCVGVMMLAACSGGGKADSPEKAVSGYIDEIKKGNVETAQSYLVAPDAVADMDTLAQADSGRIKETTSSISYEIASNTMFESATDVTAEGEESGNTTDSASYGGALVVVNITTKDMAEVANKMTATVAAQAANFTSMSEKDMKKFWDTTIESALNQTTETVTNSVNFVVVNENDDWKIKEANGFFAAAFGTGAVLDF